MNKLRFLLLLLLCGIFVGTTSAQKGVLKSANKYFEKEHYHEALKLYNQLSNVEDKKDVVYKRGVANYHTNHIDEAIKDLTLAYTLGVEEDEVYLYVGKAMHAKHEFKNAVKFYKNYLRLIKNKTEQAEIIESIKRCAFAMNLKYEEQLAFVENLGSSVNSIYDEIHPVQSPTNQNKYYFSSNRDDATGGMRNVKGLKDEIYGRYSTDMYAVELQDGNWTAVNAFHPLLNSAKNDELMDFNTSGSIMYFSKSLGPSNGEALTDTFSDNREEGAFPAMLVSPFIAELGDRDLTIFNENTILFSSKRAGGYGGYDIYIAIRVDNIWQSPLNLGPEVNSKFDEVAPFLSQSGSKLYFSSNNLSSMGGFDIFYIDYSMEGKRWGEAVNIGLPINSSRDDMYFSLSADGTIGIFSSDRVASVGGSDLYMAYIKDQVMEQLMYAETVPFLEKEVGTDSTAISTQMVIVKKDEETGSGATTAPVLKNREYINTPLYYGKDENILSPSNTDHLDEIYDITVIFPNTSILLTCHAMQEGLTEFDLYFSIKRAEKAADYLIKKGLSADRIFLRGLGSNFPLAQVNINGRVSRLADKNNRRVEVQFFNPQGSNLKIIADEPIISENLLDGKGTRYNEIVKGLSYKVLISTTKQMFKSDILTKYEHSTIEKAAGDDMYQYTLGLFDLYNQARSFKNQLVREGVVNAKVFAYLDGKRLSTAEITALQDQYPDLQQYLTLE